MVARSYTPDRGDVVWLDFAPQTGHEQQGRRPAIVLSPQTYNSKTGLALFCPITTKQKGYPFEVEIKTGKVDGVALSDQIKSLDWQQRKADFIAKATENETNEVINKLKVLIFV
jgi:mRNA interferase MazF